jgi:hypothetical protein
VLAFARTRRHACALDRDVSPHGGIYIIENSLPKDLEISLHRQEDTEQAA